MCPHTLKYNLFLLLPLLLWHPEPTQAFSLNSPEKVGIGVNGGSSYTPDPTFTYFQFNLSAIYDYEQIFPHAAPEQLKFKLEGNAGLADYPSRRLLASFNFYALYYLQHMELPQITPYIEGGVGLVYSDFQLDGQGLRINFNPQAGIGCEWRTESGKTVYGAVRAYHISNGGLHHDNRGINGVLVQFGYLF